MPEQVPTSFTFQGSTVEMSQNQKDTLQRDLDAIDNYQSIVNSELTSYNYQSSQYNSYLNRDCGSNSLPRRAEYNRCMSERNGGMNFHGPLIDDAKGKYDAGLVNWQAAIKNYNYALSSIRKDINIQIQEGKETKKYQQGAADATSTQNQSDPTVLINQQNQQAAISIKKEEEKRKIITYTIFGVVILVVIIVVIKKIF